MELENLISSFQLETLDDGWVESVWENEFMELEELPTEYLSSEEFDLVVQDFKVEIKNVLLSCSAENNESLRIWDILGQHTKRLLPVIYHFINQGKIDSENDESRSACLSSASLYFLLLSIPGSSAYRVFRTLLFENALDCFKLSSLLKEESTGRKRIQDEDYDDGDNEGLFYGQKYQLAEGLNSALLDLLSLLKVFSLKDKQTSFELVVQTLTSLTQVDNKISKLNFSGRHASKYNLPTHRNLDDLLHSLSYNAFVALYLLSRGRLQESDVACVEMVLDNLLPGLAWGGSEGTARERTIMRHNVLGFVRNCLLPIAKEQDELEGTVLTLVRHLCGAVVRMATDVRRLVCGTIFELMKEVSSIHPILEWLIRFSRSEKSGHRILSVEVLSHLMIKSKEMKELHDSMPNIIIALVERFKDVSPTVCGKALSAVSECASLPSIIDIICSSFDRELENGEKESDESGFGPMTEGENLVMALVDRTCDPRVIVRRSALQVLSNLITAFPSSYRRSILLVLRQHCLDPSSLVRKQVLLSLTNVLSAVPPHAEWQDDMKEYYEEVEESWLRGVLPQICDRDTKVRGKALEYTWNILMGRTSEPPNWRLIRKMEILRLLPFLSEAVSSWAEDKHSLGKDIWPSIRDYLHSESQYQYPAWLLLCTLSEHTDLPDASAVKDHFLKFSESTKEFSAFEECTYILMLKVLGRVSIDLSEDTAKVLESFLLNKISEFSLPFSAIRPAVDALYLMSRQVEGMPPSESSGFVPVWGVPLIHSCEQFVTSAFHARPGNAASGKGNQGRKKNQSLTSIDEEALARYLLTFADVSLICPGVVKKMTISTIQTILFPKNSSNKDHQIPPSPKLCSVAVVVLGKLCLQDARLAARIVPSLGSLLQKPPLPHPPPSDKAWAPLRNNVMCALSDMCRSFAQLVDPLLPKMSACLKSSDPTLRENALVLLVQLLQEDYLKVRRGALLFDLLTALNDEEISVSQLASYYLGRCLVHSQPSIMYQNILPALFHYNSYQGHEMYQVYRVEGDGASEKDSFGEEERRNIFRFMLQHLNDDQRQKIIGKICCEVLGGVVDGKVCLEREEGCHLLSDAIWVLLCDEIRPAGLKSGEEEGDEGEGIDELADISAPPAEVSEPGPPNKRKKNQFPGLQKEMLDVLLPIAVSLMQKLEQTGSSLLNDLMGFMANTFKEYKIEVVDLAAGDKKLLDTLSKNIKAVENK